MTKKRKLSEDQHGFLASSKRLKMSSTDNDEIADASTTHQILSSHDTGMYSTVMNI